MEEIVTQINGGIIINIDVNAKNIMYVKKIMFGILLHVIVKTANIQQVLWIKATCKTQNFYNLLGFFADYYNIDSCQYLLLTDKISSKTKTFLLPFKFKKNKLKEVLYKNE